MEHIPQQPHVEPRGRITRIAGTPIMGSQDREQMVEEEAREQKNVKKILEKFKIRAEEVYDAS